MPSCLLITSILYSLSVLFFGLLSGVPEKIKAKFDVWSLTFIMKEKLPRNSSGGGSKTTTSYSFKFWPRQHDFIWIYLTSFIFELLLLNTSFDVTCCWARGSPVNDDEK